MQIYDPFGLLLVCWSNDQQNTDPAMPFLPAERCMVVFLEMSHHLLCTFGTVPEIAGWHQMKKFWIVVKVKLSGTPEAMQICTGNGQQRQWSPNRCQMKVVRQCQVTDMTIRWSAPFATGPSVRAGRQTPCTWKAQTPQKFIDGNNKWHCTRSVDGLIETGIPPK